MTTLLTYTISTSPSTLEINQQNATLTILATNSTSNPVTISGISIEIPIGPLNTDLTDNASSISQIPPGQWTTNPPNSASGSTTFIFIPTNKAYTLASGDALVFSLTQIQVNKKAGTATLTVTEGSSGSPTQPIALSKYPEGWSAMTFVAHPPNLNAGDSVTLTWDGPNSAVYTLEYSKDNSTITIPAPGQSSLGSNGTYPGDNQPPLTLDQTTVFTLTVSQTIDNNNYQVNLQQTVTVNQPAPEIISFTGQIDYSQTPPALNLTWQTTGADYVAGSWTANTMDDNPSSPVVIQPPFLQSYTITAKSSNVNATPSKTIQLTWGVVANNIAVGDQPTGLAVSPNNQSVFVANPAGGTLSVLYVSTLAVAQTISIGFLPFGVAVAPNGSNVFVATNINYGSLVVIDANTLATTHTIGITGLRALAISPDGSQLLMAGNGGIVAIIDASTFSPIQTIAIGASPSTIVVSPNGSYAFLTNDTDNIVVIDLKTFAVIQKIAVGFLSFGIAVSPDSQYVFVANVQGTTLSVIEVSSFSVIKTISVGNRPTGVAVSPMGQCFVTNQGDNTVSVIEMNSFSVIQTIPVGNGPGAIAVSPNSQHVFVANNTGNTISVLGLQVQS